MARERLKKEELDALLTEYFAERRQLMYKLERVRDAISELKKLRGLKEEGQQTEGQEAAPKRGAGRPAAEKAAKRKGRRRKPGRRKKRTVVGGYRLSPWDMMVLDAVKSAGRLLTKQELFERTLAWAKKNAPKMKQADVEVKLTRVLQKLSGKRGVLGKHRTGLMRGLHYGLIDWFFHGKLRTEHKEKVVVPKED